MRVLQSLVSQLHSLAAHCVEASVLCGLCCLQIAAQKPQSYDLPANSSGGFHLTEVTKVPVTLTNVLFTATTTQRISQLDWTVEGTTAVLHKSEMRPDLNLVNLSGLDAGEKHQFTGLVTSAKGQSGEISLVGTSQSPGTEDKDSIIRLPYDTKNSKLSLGPVTTESGPLTLSAKPTSRKVAVGYTARGEMNVFLKGLSGDTAKGIKVKVYAEGVSLGNSDATQSVTSSDVVKPISFTAASGQKGRIITEVSGTTQSGTGFTRRSYLYVSADEDRLYTSTSGFIDLDIQQLNSAHLAHKVSDNDYQVQLNAILAGHSESAVVKQ